MRKMTCRLAVCTVIAMCITGCDAVNSRRQVDEISNKSGIVYYVPKAILHISVAGTLTFANAKDLAEYSNAQGPEKEALFLKYRPAIAVGDNVNLASTDADIQYMPDRDHAFRVKYHPAANAYDKVSIKVTKEGFLDLIQADVQDEFVQIADTLIDIGISIATKTPPAAAPQSGDSLVVPFTYEFKFDPTDANELSKVQADLAQTGFIFNITAAPEYQCTKNNGEQRSHEGVGGVYFRVPIPYQLDLTHKYANYVRQNTVNIPNKAPIAWMDISRAFAVHKVTNISFDHGMIKSWDVDKPSEILAFLDVPKHAVSAVFSIPKSAGQALVPNPSPKSVAETSVARSKAQQVAIDTASSRISTKHSLENQIRSGQLTYDQQLNLIRAQTELNKSEVDKIRANSPTTAPISAPPSGGGNGIPVPNHP